MIGVFRLSPSCAVWARGAPTYAVQAAFHARLAATHGPVAGDKIALTTPVIQQMVGFPAPVSGAILAHRRAGDGCQRPLCSRFQPRLSPGVWRLISQVANTDVLSYVGTHETSARWVQKEQRMSTQLQQNIYDQFADTYAQAYAQPRTSGFNSNLDLVIPRLVEVVGRVDGLTVLDAGCGEGIVSRSLVGTAARVVGIDIVPQLIAYARARDLTQSITYEVHDLSRPLAHYQHTFDLIVSNLVLNDVPDYRGFITTLSASLKPRGRLVLSLNNPYSPLLREKVDNYFDTGAVAQYVFGPAIYFHRTMEEYLQAFHAADLVLCRLYDVHMTEAMVAQLPEKNRHFPWYSFYHRFPFMLILDLIKHRA